MTENSPKRLRWWFWVVLFAPTILSPFIPAALETFLPGNERFPHNWILGGLYVFLALDISGAIAASIIQRWAMEKALAWLPIIFMAILFALLNAITSYGGCALVGMISERF